MKRTTAFLLGMVVLGYIVYTTTSWDHVAKLIRTVPVPSVSSTLALVQTATTTPAAVFAGDRSKPYVLVLQSGTQNEPLTWQLTVDGTVHGYAISPSAVYEADGTVVTSSNQLVFTTYDKMGTTISSATTSWNGQQIDGVAIQEATQATSSVQLASDESNAASSLIHVEQVVGQWEQTQPQMGCDFSLDLPVIQAEGGVSAESASKINATLAQALLPAAAYQWQDAPTKSAVLKTATDAKTLFLKSCRAELQSELSSFHDDPSSVGGMFQRSVGVTQTVTFVSGRYLSIISDVSTYTGGAHGSDVRIPFVFDLLTGKELELSDFVRAQDRVAFEQQVGREVLHQYHGNLFDESDAALQAFVAAGPAKARQLWTNGGSGLATSTAFYLVGNGLGFVFQQYEIAPYAVGIPEVYLPFDLK